LGFDVKRSRLARHFALTEFEIRAEAYRRIEAALKENGITFADNTPRVALYQAVPGEPAAAKRPALEQPMAAK
jgi:hypothetical protein